MKEKKYKLIKDLNTPFYSVERGITRTESEWIGIFPQLKEYGFDEVWFEKIEPFLLFPLIYGPECPVEKDNPTYSVVIHVNSREQAESIYEKVEELTKKHNEENNN